jgi:ribonuclease P protein component
MLPKSKRLTKEDFIRNRPKIIFRGELFDIAAVTLPTQKFACVIAKKTLKRAVDRNRVKRRILNTLQKIKTTSTHSFIFYPKKISLDTPYSQLHEEIKKVFATLH